MTLPSLVRLLLAMTAGAAGGFWLGRSGHREVSAQKDVPKAGEGRARAIDGGGAAARTRSNLPGRPADEQLAMRLATCERFVESLRTELHGSSVPWIELEQGQGGAEAERERVVESMTHCGVTEGDLDLFCDEPPCVVVVHGGSLEVIDAAEFECMPPVTGRSARYQSARRTIDCGDGPFQVKLVAHYDTSYGENVGVTAEALAHRVDVRVDWISEGDFCDRLEQ